MKVWKILILHSKILGMYSDAGVKVTNIVGPTMWWRTKIEPFDIPSQQCENVFEQHYPAYKLCILVSVKHFSPTKDL